MRALLSFFLAVGAKSYKKQPALWNHVLQIVVCMIIPCGHKWDLIIRNYEQIISNCEPIIPNCDPIACNCDPIACNCDPIRTLLKI
jgi:hypothetical protein